MIDLEKLKQFLCKHLIGHKFSGYEIPKDDEGIPLQVMPWQYYCKRCKRLCSVIEE